MNLWESVVLEVIGESYQKFGYWFRDVKYNSYGVKSCTSILCKSKEEADKINAGHKFDC